KRPMYFYAVEAQHKLAGKLYAAARFSEIFADKGYPIPGLGNMSDYFWSYAPASFATELWRLSLGLGYRFSDHLVVKTDYSLERGKNVGGDSRDHEDLFAVETAFQF